MHFAAYSQPKGAPDMVDRKASEHGKQEAFDRTVTDPEPISGLESGTPRPDTTAMNPDTSSLAGMDPDFGLDPHTPAAGYGGTDRGRTEMTNYTESRTLGTEGDSLRGGGGAAGADVGGAARAGDTTSDADTYSNLGHGLGEAEAGLNMSQGVTTPAASDTPPASGTHVPAPGPGNATAQATGLQSTRSPRE